MGWRDDGDLGCDTCDQVLNWSRDQERGYVISRARAKGWHVYAGASLTDKALEVYLCPACIGSSRPVPKKRGALDGDVPMFDVEIPTAVVHRDTDPERKSRGW